jgi:hypothetical protein
MILLFPSDCIASHVYLFCHPLTLSFYFSFLLPAARSRIVRHSRRTDFQQIFDDPQVQAVVIATETSSHARLAVEALRAGKVRPFSSLLTSKSIFFGD